MRYISRGGVLVVPWWVLAVAAPRAAILVAGCDEPIRYLIDLMTAMATTHTLRCAIRLHSAGEQRHTRRMTVISSQNEIILVPIAGNPATYPCRGSAR